MMPGKYHRKSFMDYKIVQRSEQATVSWQVRLSPRTAAELALWISQQGLRIEGKGQLLRLSLEALADAVVQSGKSRRVDTLQEAVEILLSFGLDSGQGLEGLDRNKRKTVLSLGLGLEEQRMDREMPAVQSFNEATKAKRAEFLSRNSQLSEPLSWTQLDKAVELWPAWPEELTEQMRLELGC